MSKAPGHGMPWKPKPSLRDIRRMKAANDLINLAWREQSDAKDRHAKAQDDLKKLMEELLGSTSFVVSNSYCHETKRHCVYVGTDRYNSKCWFCGNHSNGLY